MEGDPASAECDLLRNLLLGAEGHLSAAAAAGAGADRARAEAAAAEALLHAQTLLGAAAAGGGLTTLGLAARCAAQLNAVAAARAGSAARADALAAALQRAGVEPAAPCFSLGACDPLGALLEAQPELEPLLRGPPPAPPAAAAPAAAAPAALAELHPNCAGPAPAAKRATEPAAAPPPSEWAAAAKVPRLAGDADVGGGARRGSAGDALYGGADSSQDVSHSSGAAAAPARPAAPGFTTARDKYVREQKEQGKEPDLPAGGAPRPSGLRPPGGGGAGGGAGDNPGAGGRKFVPPYVKKALGKGDGGGLDDGPSQFTARTLELLRLSPGEPLPDELAHLEPHLVEQVCSEVLWSGGATSWDDIAGQDHAKQLIKEVVVWPTLAPHIFSGARAPPRGVLLFGPPGTGKTLLGRAVAANIDATFFSISASSLASKWIGEGEKLVRALFAVARRAAPSVIFMDEIDSLLSARKADGEHEASRRLKTEVLVQMEGCAAAAAGGGDEGSGGPPPTVLLIGATNRPEELDEAARRRLPKQLYIPLPDAAARRAMVERALRGVAADLPPADLARLVAKTDGYSGSDMKALVQEALQGPVRDAVRAAGAAVARLRAADLRPVVLRDFAAAARAQRASVQPAEIARYEEYDARHGAKLAAPQGAGGSQAEDVLAGW